MQRSIFSNTVYDRTSLTGETFPATPQQSKVFLNNFLVHPRGFHSILLWFRYCIELFGIHSARQKVRLAKRPSSSSPFWGKQQCLLVQHLLVFIFFFFLESKVVWDYCNNVDLRLYTLNKGQIVAGVTTPTTLFFFFFFIMENFQSSQKISSNRTIS